jgi:DNA mismatch repair ATPase MutS
MAVSSHVLGLVNAPRVEFNQAAISGKFLGVFFDLFTSEKAKNDAYIIMARQLLRKKIGEIFIFFTHMEHIERQLAEYNLERKSHSRLLSFFSSELYRRLAAEIRPEMTDPITEIGVFFYIHNLLSAAKSELLEAYRVVGRLDMLLSIAQLMLEHPQRYCLPVISPAPVMKMRLDHYWHPLLCQNIQFNDLDITEEEPHIVIVTGMNRGGKTTAVKAIALCQHLGGTLGAMPARSGTIPLIHSLLTSIQSRSDQELSLFESQMRKLGEIRQTIEGNQRLFLVILDEPATATSERHANAAVTSLMNRLNQNRMRIVCLITTHLEEPVRLAQAQRDNFRILYGHRDHRVNGASEGSDGNEEAEAILRKYL